MLTLKVLLPPDTTEPAGFLGVELYRAYHDFDEPPEPSFYMSGPTGNLRRNDKGEQLAEGIYCFYPETVLEARRSLDYVPDYMMHEVNPTDSDPTAKPDAG